MKAKYILFSFLFFKLTFGFSQAEIQGHVVDSITHQAVEYVVISIYKTNDTKPISGKLSDSTGAFILNGLGAAVYDLKIEFMGYRSKLIKNLSLRSNEKLTLGEISIQANSALSEIIVEGQQSTLSNKFDKQIYKADQFQAAKGGTAMDVIKNMPAVTVNAEGDIRLRGNTGFLLLLNGKPVTTDISTVLHQLPANSIENIELITAPTAKYDADGKSGIINITTKKGLSDGLSYSLNAQYGLPSNNDYNNKEKPNRYGADVTLNYKKGRWELSSGLSYQENDLAGRREGDVNTTIDNRYSSFPSVGERSFQRRNYSARASFTFTPNKSNVISAGGYIGERRQYRRADIYYNNTKTDIYTGANLGSIYYFNSNLQKKQGDFSLINIDYGHTFTNKSVLSFSGLYEYAVLDGFTKNLNVNSTEHNDTLGYVLNTANSPLNGIRFKTDYTLNLGKGKLESGYQYRHQYQTGSFLYLDAILGSDKYNMVPDFSADIQVENTIQSVYSQYNSRIEKLEYTAGLRYEYATRIFNANKQAASHRLNLSTIFPSANLLYALKDNLKIKAGYSKRVQRSNSNELNPYPEREHSETLEQGDPRILPEFVNLTELGLIKDIKKGSFFLTLYNQEIQHVVNRVNSVYTDTVLNRIYTNAGNAQLWGIETGFNLTAWKWWDIFIGGNVYDYQIHGSLFNNEVAVKNGGIAYSINTNHGFRFSKTWSAQLNLNYLSLRPTAIGEDSRFISPNLSIKKTFFSNSLALVLLWQNISGGLIKSNEQRITTGGSNFYTTTNYIQEKDVLWINLSYQFKQTPKKIKLPSSEFGEKEF
jgi:ferric enterobactin receptor